MTRKRKKQWIRAIGVLKEHYKKYKADKIPDRYSSVFWRDCPLCIIDYKACNSCLWMIFEGEDCADARYEGDTTKQRLDRLNEWEERLKREA